MRNINKCNLLFTSSGRRVSLIRAFRKTYDLHGIEGSLITADLKPTAPSAFEGDRHYLVPRVSSPDYIAELLEICRKESITGVIPLIDTELELLSRHRPLFEQIGVKLLLSGGALNELAGDKRKTYAFFAEQGIPTPKVYNEEEIERRAFDYPVMLKPSNGSSSNGVTKIRNEKELNFFLEYIPNAMVQEYVEGAEYTVDVMTDFEGNIKTIVPRLRVETRAGEVSKGITKKDESIIAAAERAVKLLPGPVGCITLQCFKLSGGEIVFIEINPRFGGGIPLSIEAGADFPLWTVNILQGERFEHEDYGWTDNLTMMRYDDAVFRRGLSYEY